MKIQFVSSAAVCATIVFALSDCSDRDEPSTAAIAVADAGAAVPKSEMTASSIDSWLGKWIGPEGTSLILSKQGEDYDITIQTLDGPANYQGKQSGDRIEFVRNGKTESIRATSGKDTGMKWLQEKTNCLTINLGEGFCRETQGG